MVRIEQIAVTRSGADLFATGAFEESVTVWSFKELRKVSEINTILDFGGNRLAVLDGPPPIVVSGSWSRGVQAYDARTGEVLWTRKDLVHSQELSDFSKCDSPLVGVGLEAGRYLILCGRNGLTVQEFSGIKKVYPHPFEDRYLCISSESAFLSNLTSASIWMFPLRSFAVLDATFGESTVAYSESAGCVYYVDFFGEQARVFTPERDRHVLELAWEGNLRRWLAIDWNYEIGGAKRLLELDCKGEAVVLDELGNCAQQKFFRGGRYIITSERTVIATSTYEKVWDFAVERS